MPGPQRTSTDQIEQVGWPSRIRSLRVHMPAIADLRAIPASMP